MHIFIVSKLKLILFLQYYANIWYYLNWHNRIVLFVALCHPVFPFWRYAYTPYQSVFRGPFFLWGVKRDKVSSGDPFFYGMACVTCVQNGAYILCILCRVCCVCIVGLCILYGPCSASNDLLSFPHINNSRPRYGESSKGPKTPHPTHHHPGRSWLHACRDRLPSPDIAPRCPPDIPRIAFYASSYHIQTSPINACPDTEQVCPSRNSLSGRTGHRIRPDYEQHSRTVLCHINIGRITSSMPYHDPQRKKAKR